MQSMALSIADFVFYAGNGRVDASNAEAGACDRDWADIRGSVNGEPEAYARLVARYQPQVFQQMWRFARDVHVQDELVQEVFIEVYRSLARFRGDAPFVHWVRRIATRVGYRHWKRQAHRHRLEEALKRAYVEPVLEPEDQTEVEAAECLHALLAQLPPKERLILTLAYFEDCNSTEIAARMGWNATMVRVRAHRARQKLKRLLEEAGFGR